MKRATSFLFLASVFCVTFEKVHWNFAGTVSLADVLAIGFLAAFAAGTRRWRVPRTTAVLLGFLAVFLLVYLAGYFDLSDSDALAQWGKGLTKWLIHFAFLAAAVVWLSRRGQRYFWRTLGWFSAGIVVNAAYGVLQLLDARRGGNLDATLLSPITGGASQINIYGAINGASVFRPNAMTGDPNHLGIMLIVPLLVLTPLYLRLERGHRMRRWLAPTIGFLLIVEAATLSRSGLLGLGVGALDPRRPVPAVPALAAAPRPDRRRARDPRRGSCSRGSRTSRTILKSRVQTSGGSESAHFQVYSFIPHVLHTDPLFGLGLNTFSVYYEFVTGKTNWGPHSYYVALLVETGLVGTALFGLFLLWIFRRLHAARALGRALAAAHDPLAARVRPLAWGCTAALVGTLASNAFYLTMQFYYFYAFVALALAIPVVFSQRGNEGRRPDDVVPARRGQRWRETSSRRRSRRRAARRRCRRRLARLVPAFRGRATAAESRRTCARRRGRLPWCPPFLAAFAVAARRAARDADLVHAHWIPSALAARATGKPYVLQVWGTDVELARRAPWLVRPLVRGARARDRRVVVPRRGGAGARRARGACRAAAGATSRGTSASPSEPPHVLFAGRLSEEKGILEFVEATAGLAARDRRRRAAARPRPGGARLRRRRRSSARTTSGRRWSACRRAARATG